MTTPARHVGGHQLAPRPVATPYTSPIPRVVDSDLQGARIALATFERRVIEQVAGLGESALEDLAAALEDLAGYVGRAGDLVDGHLTAARAQSHAALAATARVI